MNVALYGPGGGKWAFTEYACARAESDSLSIGRNVIAWTGQGLTCQINESAAPLPSPIRGTVRLYPQVATRFALALDREDRHWWQPIAPRARIEVDLQRPALRWSGTGYLDTNHGAAPLDEAMRSWTWLRAHTRTRTTVIYDLAPLNGMPTMHALDIDSTGNVHAFTPPPRVSLPATTWRIPRETHADFGFVPKVIATFEDAPFYARTLLDTMIRGERTAAVHESLSLERFRSSWVRMLLPFRMRRSRR